MRAVILLAVVTGFLVSCVNVKPTLRVERGAGWYTVKVSDTLYSIAWRYGLDSKQLADWNQIAESTPIHPGQRLRLVRPPGVPIVRAGKPKKSAAKEVVTATTRRKTRRSDSDTTIGKRNTAASLANPKKWLWPTVGKPLNTFLASDLDRRGIDIGGKLGQPVRAVADGKVVYSGNGLAGYGNLIIIKHSDTYLSAYAYCQERLVREGTAVEAGKVVAKMGLWNNMAKLHFEIRRDGKPVDPMKYLPNSN